MKARFEGASGGGDARSSEAIRSNIENTREKMDQTLDRLEERLTPRHLIDELLDYLRSRGLNKDDVKEKANLAASKAGDAAGKAIHAITDLIREHPIPTLLVGAGIAYAVYERQHEDDDYAEDYYEIEEDEMPYSYETPIIGQHEATGEEEYTGEGKLKRAKEKVQAKIGDTADHLKEKGKELKERVAQKGQVIRIKASELKRRMASRAQATFSEKREQVARMSDEHPLSTGIGLMAAGLLLGLALPHTRKEDEFLGRTSDKMKAQVRERGEELVERGKNVASTALNAAKGTAEQEGLTPEQIKEKAGRVISEAKTAAQQSLHQEGLTGEALKDRASDAAEQAKSAAKPGVGEKGCGCEA